MNLLKIVNLQNYQFVFCTCWVTRAHTSNPSYYIRHIYNRLVLENSIVRSSAVIALAKFAAVCGGEVSKNIVILLERCLNDVDDEVRDRAAISLNFINNGKKNLIVSDSKYDLNALEVN